MNYRAGWKVVMKEEGEIGYFSCIISASPHLCRYGVYYQHNEWADRTRGCGPLAVFADFELAEDFVNRNLTLRFAVFKSIRVEYLIIPCMFMESYEQKLYIPFEMTVFLQQLPFGTRFADRVMLLDWAEYDE